MEAHEEATAPNTKALGFDFNKPETLKSADFHESVDDGSSAKMKLPSIEQKSYFGQTRMSQQ